MPTLRTCPARDLRIGLAWLALICATLLCGCGPSPRAPPDPSTQLTVIVRPGPTSWFAGADGETRGFEHDLITRFAQERHVPLTVIVADSAAALIGKLRAGESNIAAGGLFAPLGESGIDDAPPVPLWTQGYYAVEPVLIYNIDGYKPKSIGDLAGGIVAFPAHTGLDGQLAVLRKEHPEITWMPVDAPSNDALIAQVSAGDIDYAVVPSDAAAVARNIFLDFEMAFPVGAARAFAWALAPGQEALRDALNDFFARMRKDGSLKRYSERYFASERQIERIDASALREKIGTMLPRYRSTFQQAQAATGIEWRLLAAIAYQESQWDPLATSETGVRGLMQLTEETARHLGVVDRLDERHAALAAARYLRDLKDRLPARITEPDRTWLALAEFNIGIAHVEDARILAQKQNLNPDVWNDVRKTLPLLAQPEYYEQAKYGYARGGMPVAFVDRVRGYYDVLARAEPSYQPRLRAWSLAGPPEWPAGASLQTRKAVDGSVQIAAPR